MFKILDPNCFGVVTWIMRSKEPVASDYLRVSNCGPGRVSVEIRNGRTIAVAQMDAVTARAIAQSLSNVANQGE